jgi:hypothetical protein
MAGKIKIFVVNSTLFAFRGIAEGRPRYSIQDRDIGVCSETRGSGTASSYNDKGYYIAFVSFFQQIFQKKAKNLLLETYLYKLEEFGRVSGASHGKPGSRFAVKRGKIPLHSAD